MFSQDRFNFAGLNAETANFHLVIGPAQELDRAVWQIAGQIPGPVERAPRALY